MPRGLGGVGHSTCLVIRSEAVRLACVRAGKQLVLPPAPVPWSSEWYFAPPVADKHGAVSIQRVGGQADSASQLSVNKGCYKTADA